MEHRLFVGIKVSGMLLDNIMRWQEHNKDLPVRFIKKKNLHITLAPPWYEQNTDKIIKILESFHPKIKPFKVHFRTIESGPKKSLRLIWAKGDNPSSLKLLSSNLTTLLKQKPQDRMFSLHLTLARIAKHNTVFFVQNPYKSKINWKEKISSYCLYESKLLSTGAEYKVLQEFSL